jgi:hypothetical protein
LSICEARDVKGLYAPRAPRRDRRVHRYLRSVRAGARSRDPTTHGRNWHRRMRGSSSRACRRHDGGGGPSGRHRGRPLQVIVVAGASPVLTVPERPEPDSPRRWSASASCRSASGS